MATERVRIVDIAEELGLSTATVSNVIHGKTKKLSDETVKRVQELLEKRRYLPGRAEILLAQNDAKTIGAVICDHEKYEGRPLEDPFISASINALSKEAERAGKFLMLKVTDRWADIPRFASMWNMEGMVLIGFCAQDYKKLREQLHIPFVVYDGYMEDMGRLANLSIDHFDGGAQAGRYLKSRGHRKVLCIADNNICMDRERFLGLKSELSCAELMVIPMKQEARARFYREHLADIRKYSAIFAVSDFYAVELLQFLTGTGVSVPEDVSVIGFDGVWESEKTIPPLTTIKQDHRERAVRAVKTLEQLKADACMKKNILLPVALLERGSVRDINLHK